MRFFRMIRLRRKAELFLQRGLLWILRIPTWLADQGAPWWWSTTVLTQSESYWEAGRTEWYTWLLPITKSLPSSFAGWWYLQWWYGAGYYQYRFTLIAMVDNYRVVDLHALGYLKWRRWWRTRAYPRLVGWFPRWGNLTTGAVWWAHQVVAHVTWGLTTWYHTWTTAVTARLMTPRLMTPRWSLGVKHRRRVQRYKRPVVKLPWRPIRVVQVWRRPPRRWRLTLGGQPRRWVRSGPSRRWPPFRVGWTPISHPGWVVPAEETALTDEEWLTLDGVFPVPENEPFQEDFDDQFESQQDDHHDDDDEPFNPEDTIYGTDAVTIYEDLEEVMCSHTYQILRYVDPSDLPRVPPYCLRTGEVTSFHLREPATWDTLVGAGDGPTLEDDDRDEPDYNDDAVPEVADWYTWVTKSVRLSDDEPPVNDWTGWWRTRRGAQPVAMVSRPDRLYLVDRLHPRWWHLKFRTRRFRAWKRLLRRWRYGWLRRPHRRGYSAAGPRASRHRSLRRRYRFTRVKGWHHSSRRRWDWWWWTWRRWPTRFSARYWRGWATRRVATRRVAHSAHLGWDFAQRHETHLENEGLTLPGGWARWVLPRRARLHTPAGHYPRYHPSHTGRADTLRIGLAPWGDPGGPPVEGWLLVAVLIGDALVGLILDVGTTPMGDPWWWKSYSVGASPWWEHLRLAPPRGWWSWPGNPGVDANLYVWGWWADYFIPYLDGTGEVTSPDYIPGSLTWRSLSDARFYRGNYKFYPSFPPWLPTYLSMDPRFHTLTSYGPDMWIDYEPHTLARTVNTRYMRGAGSPPMMYRALAAWYRHDEYEQLIKTSPADAWPSSIFLHLPNPTWVAPRDYLGGGEPARMDARWLRGWSEISPYHNWVCIDHLKRAYGWWSWGRRDWTNPWGWSPDLYSRRWPTVSGISSWEVHLNKELLAQWHTTAATAYADRPRHGVWWLNLSVPQLSFQVDLLRWWFLIGGFTWWWCRTTLVVAPAVGVASYPVSRWSSKGRSHRVAPAGGFHPDGSAQRHRRNHQWRGIRQYDERHTLVDDYGFDWRWRGWYHYFEVARQGHNSMAPHRTRRASGRPSGVTQVQVASSITRVKGRPRRVPNPAQVILSPPGWVPTRVGSYWSPGRGWSWLVRGIHPTVGVTLSADVTAGEVFTDERNSPHIWRRTSEISEFPASLRQPDRRYYGPTRTGMLDHVWAAGHQPGRPRPTWRITPPWWARRVVHTWWTSRWRTTLRGVGHPTGGHHHPGWWSWSIETGYDTQVYEDDHNEMYLGLQPDDEYAEWGDLENPLAQHHAVRYLSPEAEQLTCVTTPLWNVTAYPRWGVPSAVYTAGYPATYFSEEAYPAGWMTWSPAGVDHPAWEVTLLNGYGLPRWYRRLTRWATPRWSRYRGPRKGGRPDWKGPWRRPRPVGSPGGRHRVYEMYDPAGGDLLWDTPGAVLVDELYQTGWVHQDSYSSAEWSHDDWDTLSVGGLSGLGVGYRPVYLTLGQRPRWEPTVWTTGGLNGGRYLLGETAQGVSDPEGYWLDWLGHDYDEPHTDVEAWGVDQGHGPDRAPEDPHENPNDGEYNEEVPSPRANDLPGWVVAAAVAGTSPGEYDPTARVDRLATEVGYPGGFAEVGPRLDVRATMVYYRAWARYRRGGSFPRRVARPRWFPLLDNDGGSSAGVATPLYNALNPTEVGGMLPGGMARLQRDALLREHIRLWALTEVYYGDGGAGPRLNA